MGLMGIVKAIAPMAFGPMSGIGLAMKLQQLVMKKLGAQMAMNLIQRMGQQSGMSQAKIDLAQAAFASRIGQPGLVRQNLSEAVRGLANQMDLRPSEAGALMRELSGAADKSFENLCRIASSFVNDSGGGGEDNTTASKGDSWLVAFAKAMGKALDAKAKQMKEKSDSIASMAGSDVDRKSSDGMKHQEKLSSETQLLQAYSQEMSMIANTASNALKTVGEAQSTIARKG